MNLLAHTLRRRSFLALPFALAGRRGLFAQDPAQEGEIPTISVDVEVVNLLATVRDKKGRLIGDLEKKDFFLKIDGAATDIRYFARQTDLPLTVGLLVDTSVSQQRLIEVERSAGYQFYDAILRTKKDLAFLMSFDIDVELLQDLTDSRNLLHEGLQGLAIQGASGGVHPGPVPTSSKPVGTALYDGVYLAAREVLRNQVGRKALVLISDGNDYGSKVDRDEAIAASHRADVVVYGIRYFDREFYYRSGGLGTGGSSTLKRLAEETGGGMYEVSRKQTLKDIFDQIQAEMRNQYSIGFSPNSGSNVKDFRKIDLGTGDKDLKVRCRAGYYSKG